MNVKRLSCGCTVMEGAGRYQVMERCQAAIDICQSEFAARNARDEEAHNRALLAYHNHMKAAR